MKVSFLIKPSCFYLLQYTHSLLGHSKDDNDLMMTNVSSSAGMGPTPLNFGSSLWFRTLNLAIKSGSFAHYDLASIEDELKILKDKFPKSNFPISYLYIGNYTWRQGSHLSGISRNFGISGCKLGLVDILLKMQFFCRGWA